MKLSKLALVLVVLLPFIIGVGCSDKSSNSNDDIPAELLGTWLFSSGTIGGEPMTIDNIEYVDESAVTHSITFEADGTYGGTEYDESMNPVSTMSGTFSVKSDTLNTTVVEIDDVPVTPIESEAMTFEVSGSVLILNSVDIAGQPVMAVVLIYSKM